MVRALVRVAAVRETSSYRSGVTRCHRSSFVHRVLVGRTATESDHLVAYDIRKTRLLLVSSLGDAKLSDVRALGVRGARARQYRPVLTESSHM